MSLQYVAGSALGDAALFVKDDNRNLINLASGYTFTGTVKQGTTTQFSMVNGQFAGAAGSLTSDPHVANLVLAWDVGELNTLAAGSYALIVIGTRTSDSKPRVWKFPLSIIAAA